MTFFSALKESVRDIFEGEKEVPSPLEAKRLAITTMPTEEEERNEEKFSQF